MTYPHPIIAREGWLFIGIALVVAGLVTAWAGWWSLPFWLILVFVVQFFRDPAALSPSRRCTTRTPTGRP